MMLKTNSKRSRRSRVLYVLPMIALALSAFATPEFQTATEVIEEVVQQGETIVDLYINSKGLITKCSIDGNTISPDEGRKIMEGKLDKQKSYTLNITSEIELPKVEREIQSPSKPTNLKVNYKVVPPESESGKETVIDIHIDSEDKLSCGINHAKLEPISPKDMMELLAKHRGEPTVINITSEKEFDHMEHVVREASRKNNLLKINYEAKPKSD